MATMVLRWTGSGPETTTGSLTWLSDASVGRRRHQRQTQRLDDLAVVPGNRLEALAGNRKGQHSIRVNQQYRITFRWERHDAYDVCCEDDH
jgi:proteic killer suppression protein